jgi:hypothetical protein
LIDVSEVLAASVIALMMEAVSTSATSVSFYQTTRHNIPDDIYREEQVKLPLILFYSEDPLM